MIHCLKIAPEYFEAVVIGKKSFEVRFDDRGYSVGDQLFLKEYSNSTYTGRCYNVFVSYVLRDFQGLAPGYVVLALRR